MRASRAARLPGALLQIPSASRWRVRSPSLRALRVPVGQRGTQGPLGRWLERAWRLRLLGVLVGGGAGRPSPPASAVASAPCLHGSPRGRRGGSQVSARNNGSRARTLELPGFRPSLSSEVWAPHSGTFLPRFPCPGLGISHRSGEGREGSGAAAPACPGRPRPLRDAPRCPPVRLPACPPARPARGASQGPQRVLLVRLAVSCFFFHSLRDGGYSP